jgi:hypothetical protein
MVIVAIMPSHSKFLKRSQGFLIAINGTMGVFSHFCVSFFATYDTNLCSQ